MHKQALSALERAEVAALPYVTVAATEITISTGYLVFDDTYGSVQ
jgi:hypothetical protein